jgi:hypothetical protein
VVLMLQQMTLELWWPLVALQGKTEVLMLWQMARRLMQEPRT